MFFGCRVPTGSAPDPFAEVLRDAYAVFKVDPPENLNVCTNCCMEPAEHRAMLCGDPSRIDELHLISWFNAAYIDEEFSHQIGCYLAPRIMEFAAGTNDYIDHEMMFARVPLGDVSQWTDGQNDVIRRYNKVFLDWFRTRTKHDLFLDDVLCMFSLGLFPARQSLDHVMGWSDEDLINRLWIDSQHVDGPTLWQSVWWDWGREVHQPRIAQARAEILAWYRGQELRDRIDRYLETAGPDSTTWSRAAHVEVALAKGV